MTYRADSATTLFLIRNQHPWKQYVLRRVSEICSLTLPDQWRHCINPADLPSCGVEAQKLQDCTVWWEGPPFLKSFEEESPSLVDPQPSDTIMAELTKTSAQDTHMLG